MVQKTEILRIEMILMCLLTIYNFFKQKLENKGLLQNNFVGNPSKEEVLINI